MAIHILEPRLFTLPSTLHSQLRHCQLSAINYFVSAAVFFIAVMAVGWLLLIIAIVIAVAVVVLSMATVVDYCSCCCWLLVSHCGWCCSCCRLIVVGYSCCHGSCGIVNFRGRSCCRSRRWSSIGSTRLGGGEGKEEGGCSSTCIGRCCSCCRYPPLQRWLLSWQSSTYVVVSAAIVAIIVHSCFTSTTQTEHHVGKLPWCCVHHLLFCIS